MAELLFYCICELAGLGLISAFESTRVNELSSLVFPGWTIVAYAIPAIIIGISLFSPFKIRLTLFVVLLLIMIGSYINQIRHEIIKADLTALLQKEPRIKTTEPTPSLPPPLWTCKQESSNFKSCYHAYQLSIWNIQQANIKIDKHNEKLERKEKLSIARNQEIDRKNDLIRPDYSDVYIIGITGTIFAVFFSVSSIALIERLIIDLKALRKSIFAFQRTRNKFKAKFRKKLQEARLKKKEEKDRKKKNKDLVEALPDNSRIFLKVEDLKSTLGKTNAVKQVAEDEKCHPSRIWKILENDNVPKELKNT